MGHTRSVTGHVAARATVRDAWAVREFRAVLGSVTLSVLGDQVARIAVALLVHDSTGSAFAASATYACSYLSWLVAGPLLSALADRYPRRRLMVACDLARAALVAVLVVPGLPLPAVFAVLVLVGLLAPPFDAAKGALLPEILEGDRYVSGSALVNTLVQAAQVAGFLLGGAVVAAATARGALVLDATSFLLSALLLTLGVRERRGAAPRGRSLARDAAEGVRVVVRDPVLRRLLGFGLVGMAATIVPEGLAVPVSRAVGGSAFTAGALTAALPAGFLVGSLLVLRVPPERRGALLGPLTLATCLPLVLTPLASSGVAVGVLWALAGAGSAVQLVANATYMTSAPPAMRARAYGVAVSALMAVQGAALLLAGAFAEVVDPRVAVATAALLALLPLPLLRRPAADLRPSDPPEAPAAAAAGVPGHVG